MKGSLCAKYPQPLNHQKRRCREHNFCTSLSASATLLAVFLRQPCNDGL